ncbi:PREDICTED: peptidyl-prolyl cis-trans isomerase FKBP17-1, chloroplastic [Nicotiana attenuata]|uniref:peptidylprolyl isomerase n=1 Tax=Nicotiana attenuata TaxID=49451 RepID=A0A1J6IM30_NICAT|nr:PREDICTED: peptidyl-prolyl cis-trans isomerase FKBP17-1, chloroplastic [Nicotiana attenuata]OIT06205.1 peptidyl-prolyl cis-trans isomerase fkbp17-1, chloroplastic [Nicotiana attenuata]
MAMIKLVQCSTYVYTRHCHRALPFSTTRNQVSCASSCSTQKSRRAFSLSAFTLSFSALIFSNGPSSNAQVPQFTELPNSGGVKALDLRIGDGDTPLDGDVVAIHYYGRLAAKQGWRFDSTYDHKDETGEPIPFSFILGSGKVISGIESAVRSMKVGGLRRVIIPPSQGYQNTSQEPLPPNYFDRQRLFTTIFNPTRLANGEGATLGTVIFDIELVSLRHL